MNLKRVLLVLGLAFYLTSFSQAVLLKQPESVDQADLNQKASSTSLTMKWLTRLPDQNTQISLAFDHQDGKAMMKIEIEGEFPVALEKHKDRFQLKTQAGNEAWLLIYGPSTRSETALVPASVTLEEEMGIVHLPRELDQGQAKKITITTLAHLIGTKKCVFYTGAGTSAGVVPTMPQLMQCLGFTQQGKFIEIIDKALKDPDSLIKIMEEFYASCLFGRPTPAHIAVKNIVLNKDWGLMTENLDLLHQRTKIKPLTHEAKDWLRENVSIEDLKKIDYVIAIGLARDESGFLGWYKHHNPKGKIVAINLQQPCYLDEQDFFVEGDIQELLPSLQKELGA
jgi:NAD-dependent SIR2 family protein deacetylase